MRRSLVLIPAFVLGLLLAAHEAQAGTFLIDPNYSVIVHKIKHLMGYSIGTFEKFSGTIKINDDKEQIVQIDAAIDVTSLNTRNKERDEDLRSEHFFDTKKFPTANFHSTKITKNRIIGELTLKDVTKPVTLEYTWAGTGKDQYGNTKMALSAKGEVNRKDFGITHNFKSKDDKWILGDKVELSIEIQGKLEE